jgi:hypothetical protein
MEESDIQQRIDTSDLRLMVTLRTLSATVL